MTKPVLHCDEKNYCDPLAYCLAMAPHNQPWAPYVDVLSVDGVVRRAVFVSFPGKAPGLGGKRVIWRHCPFCAGLIDPTIEDKPRRWYTPWRRRKP